MSKITPQEEDEGEKLFLLGAEEGPVKKKKKEKKVKKDSDEEQEATVWHT